MKLSPIESFFYNMMCVFSFGTVWMQKTVAKKAYLDALKAAQKAT